VRPGVDGAGGVIDSARLVSCGQIAETRHRAIEAAPIPRIEMIGGYGAVNIPTKENATFSIIFP
jgi:hypothetical protein